jgi:hypothetical protein
LTAATFFYQLQQHIVSHVWLQQQHHLWQLLQPHSQPSFEKVTAQYKSFLAAAIMPFSTIFQSKIAPYLIAVVPLPVPSLEEAVPFLAAAVAVAAQLPAIK